MSGTNRRLTTTSAHRFYGESGAGIGDVCLSRSRAYLYLSIQQHREIHRRSWKHLLLHFRKQWLLLRAFRNFGLDFGMMLVQSQAFLENPCVDMLGEDFESSTSLTKRSSNSLFEIGQQLRLVSLRWEPEGNAAIVRYLHVVSLGVQQDEGYLLLLLL
ncbi:hypothetical protein Tco_0014805 [Tanacetum coccineum]